VDAGAGNIMSAYMPVNGVPATGNHWLLTDVLRNEWGFKGWTVSDNNAVVALSTHHFAADGVDAAARALSAGLDMEMAFSKAAYANLPAAMAAGKIEPHRLDEAVTHVLAAKIRLGLFENPFVDEAQAAKVLRSPANLAAARLAAERAAVLLKNEGGLLPLDRKKLRRLAVIGPLADSAGDALGPWIFPTNAPAKESILEGLRAKLGAGVEVTYSPGVAVGTRLHASPLAFATGILKRPAPEDDDSGITEAVTAAQAADVAILVLGETKDMIGELASRSSLDLPGRQQQLLDAVVATGKPVVIVLMNGRPLDLKDTKAAAILDIWYPGSRGGTATANLLFGDAVPGG
jgi:beta-glucosidase